MSNKILVCTAIINVLCNISCHGMFLEQYHIENFNGVFNRNLTFEEMSDKLQSNESLNKINNNYNIGNLKYNNTTDYNDEFWKELNEDISDAVQREWAWNHENTEANYTKIEAYKFIKKHDLDNETMNNGVIFDALMKFGNGGVNKFISYLVNRSLVQSNKDDRELPSNIITADNIVQYVIAYKQSAPLLSTYKLTEDDTILKTPLNLDNYYAPTSALNNYEIIKFTKNNTVVISINMKQNVLTDRITYTFTNNNKDAAYNFFTIAWLLNNTNDRAQKILYGLNSMFNNIANNKITIQDNNLFLYVFEQLILNIKQNARDVIQNSIEENNTNKCKLLDNMLNIINNVNYK